MLNIGNILILNIYVFFNYINEKVLNSYHGTFKNNRNYKVIGQVVINLKYSYLRVFKLLILKI